MPHNALHGLLGMIYEALPGTFPQNNTLADGVFEKVQNKGAPLLHVNVSHAKNETTASYLPVPSMPNAGTMAYRRDLPSITSI